jgi:hypothetical protein
MSRCPICLEKEEKYNKYIIYNCCRLKLCKPCFIKMSTLCPICDRDRLNKKVFKCSMCDIPISLLDRIHDSISWEDYCQPCYDYINTPV